MSFPMERLPAQEHFSATDDAVRIAAVEFAARHPQRCRELCGELAIAAADANDTVSMAAAEALEMMGPPAPSTLPVLMNLAGKGHDGETVYWAVTLIGRMGPAAARATACLTATLTHSPYLPARERAAWAIARIGTPAQSALEALRKAVETGPPRLSRLATQAIESIRGMAA